MKPDNDNKEDGRKAYQGDERQGKVDNALEKMFVHDLYGVMLRRGELAILHNHTSLCHGWDKVGNDGEIVGSAWGMG